MQAGRICLWLTILVGLISCSKEDKQNSPPLLGGEFPSYFPAPVYPFDLSSRGDQRFELGKKLFFDTNLSLDSTISCASCHKSAGAFSDPGNAVSEGIFGRVGLRNAPALFNLAWKPSMMWDGGIIHLEFQPLAPLTDPNEMAVDLSLLVDRLNLDQEYKSLFEKAYGSSEITSQKIFLSFARYLSSLVSAGSAYDQFVQGDASALTGDELLGLKIFRQHCESCHKEPLFSDFSFRNNGIEASSTDSGRARITLLPQDRNKFIVPSLRNIGFSAPYMHDGRFNTLEEVINHYSSHENYQAGFDADLPLQNLSNQEKEALKAFLLSLNDYTFVNNPGFGNPNFQ
jgi:cytochrome c peroxidase